MEKILKDETHNRNNESLLIQCRKTLKIEGIVEVVSTSDSLLNLKLKDTSLTITGEQINIEKLDINLGILEANGKFVSIKYGKSGNIFKRLFKWKLATFCNLKTFL